MERSKCQGRNRYKLLFGGPQCQKIAAYPLTLLNASMGAMQKALVGLKNRQTPPPVLTFDEIREIVGFNNYYELERRYSED